MPRSKIPSLNNLPIEVDQTVQITFRVSKKDYTKLTEILNDSVHVKPIKNISDGFRLMVKEFIFHHRSFEPSLFYKWSNDDYYNTTLKFGDLVN